LIARTDLLHYALALLLAIGLIAAVYPGYLSFDSSYVWWQARTGQMSNLSAPGFTLSVALLGPTLPVIAQIVGYFLLIAALPRALGCGRVAAWVVFAALALCPPMLVLLPHLWSDVQLTVCLLAASLGLLLGAASQPRGYLLALIAVLLIYAVQIRLNALAAVVPLACAWGFLLDPRPRRALVACAALLATAFAVSSAINQTSVREQRSAWAVPVMWDLQAMSIASDQMLLPASVQGPGLDVAQLRTSFDQDTAVGLFSRTRSGVAGPGAEEFSRDRKSALVENWMAAIRAQPWTYLQHRTRVFSRLIGAHRDASALGLVDFPSVVQYLDNPPLAQPNSRWHDAYRALAEGLKASGLIAPWIYLSAGIALGIYGLRRGPWRMQERVLLSIGLSGLLYLVPYFIIAPSTELRYAAWAVVACLLAGLGLSLNRR